MKQNYILYLMGLLSIGQMTLSVNVPQSVLDFRAYFQDAETAQRNGDMDTAYIYWGQAADIALPPRDYTKADPYISDRSKQTDAVEKLADRANALKSAGNNAGALKIYQLAPLTFASEISVLK